MDDATRPLYAQTQAVLSALDLGNPAALLPLTTDDLTLVDTDGDGRPTLLPDRGALTAHLDARAGETRSSTILAYDGHPGHEMGWSIVRFRRAVTRARERQARHELCSATLLWQLTAEGWKLARWHCSILRIEAANG